MSLMQQSKNEFKKSANSIQGDSQMSKFVSFMQEGLNSNELPTCGKATYWHCSILQEMKTKTMKHVWKLNFRMVSKVSLCNWFSAILNTGRNISAQRVPGTYVPIRTDWVTSSTTFLGPHPHVSRRFSSERLQPPKQNSVGAPFNGQQGLAAN